MRIQFYHIICVFQLSFRITKGFLIILIFNFHFMKEQRAPTMDMTHHRCHDNTSTTLLNTLQLALHPYIFVILYLHIQKTYIKSSNTICILILHTSYFLFSYILTLFV
jgi:hypothetical protein